MIGLWIGLGGGVGALGRFAISGWVTTWAFAGFPWGTLLVNVLGSLALGFFARVLISPAVAPGVRACLIVGFCGGFTTFSTFDFENLSLIRQGEVALAATYIIASVATCVAAVIAGMMLGELARREVRSRPEPG